MKNKKKVYIERLIRLRRIKRGYELVEFLIQTLGDNAEGKHLPEETYLQWKKISGNKSYITVLDKSIAMLQKTLKLEDAALEKLLDAKKK